VGPKKQGQTVESPHKAHSAGLATERNVHAANARLTSLRDIYYEPERFNFFKGVSLALLEGVHFALSPISSSEQVSWSQSDFKVIFNSKMLIYAWYTHILSPEPVYAHQFLTHLSILYLLATFPPLRLEGSCS
jgi:hypothetical protein